MDPMILLICQFFTFIFNFVVQVLYLYDDKNVLYYTLKKISTPLMLLGGGTIILLKGGDNWIVRCFILFAMGIGELGMEGTNIVEAERRDERTEKKKRKRKKGPGTPLYVTLAAVLFLFVNLFLGSVLIYFSQEKFSAWDLLSSFLIAFVFLVAMQAFLVHFFSLDAEKRFQIRAYSCGICILFTGSLLDLKVGLTRMGMAGLTLSVSDALTLFRMGTNFNKNDTLGFYLIFVQLVIILILYSTYVFILSY